MRILLSSFICILSLQLFGQLKYDNNWVFGFNSGYDFGNDVAFVPKGYNYEVGASISEPTTGELLFYYSDSVGISSNPLGTLRNQSNQQIENGDSLIIYGSCTNGMVIIPSDIEGNFYIFHVGSKSLGNCSGSLASCNDLFYSKVILNSFLEPVVDSKNIKMYDGFVDEKVIAIKHSDGHSWWIIARKTASNMLYLAYVLNDSLILDSVQVAKTSSLFDFIGEIAVSLDGTMLAIANNSSNSIDVFNFNRCDGSISFINSITNVVAPYGLEFSPNREFLYVSSTAGSEDSLYQYRISSISSTNIIPRRLISANSSQAIGQLEIGPDNKIYVAYQGSDNLAVVNHPDSLGLLCDFQKVGITLATSSTVDLGLPNFPNYNLGPLPVFAATAGPDTIQCNNGYGVELGSPSVTNVVYQWSPTTALSNANIAQPLASPETDTWYYLTVTDTTATSCAVNVDSVFVQVTHCTGIDELVLEKELVLYPNPTTEYLYLSTNSTELIQVTLFSLDGKEVSIHQVQSGQPVDVSYLNPGLYIYLVEGNGKIARGKTIIK